MKRPGLRIRVLLLVTGLLGVTGCAYESAGTTTSTAADEAMLPPATGPAAIVFEDQMVDGAAVVVASVDLPAEGFVVVQSDLGGNPDAVIGVSAALGRGTTAEVVVPLDVPLESAALLHATLHVDMDRDGRFLYEPPDDVVDVPAVTAGGEVAAAAAMVSLLAPVSPAAVGFEDQRSDGEEVVVAEVTLPAPGFVALHRSEDGLPGGLLGISDLLPAGTSRDVVIPLAEPVAGVHQVFAVAYVDRDGDGVAGITSGDSPDEVALGADGRPARAAAEVTVVLVAPAALDAADQEGDGTSVLVASAVLPSPGFVEIRLEGSPGRRLAVSDLLPMGTTGDLSIELSDPLTADAVLLVRVRIDLDGDGALGEDDPVALTEGGSRAQASVEYTFVEADDS